MEPPVANVGHILRRRKKRSSAGQITGAPGSSLSGLNRNSIHVVELMRRSTGYGFTISGQKPCLLRSIVEGSAAALAGLRLGHCLVGVNGKDVSHLSHDDVVTIIGNCIGLLRLHVAESYFSESSDDETFSGRTREPFPSRVKETFPYSNPWIQHHSPVPKKKLPATGNRRMLRQDPVSKYSPRPSALRQFKVLPRDPSSGNSYTTMVTKIGSSSSRPLQPVQFCTNADDFETDLNSLEEILADERNTPRKPPIPSRAWKNSLRDRFSLNHVPKPRPGRNHRQRSVEPVEPSSDVEPPRPIEVSVLISPKKNLKRDKRRSMNLLRPISPSQYEQRDGDRLNSSALYPAPHVSCARNGGTRSLDNLCSPEILTEDFQVKLPSRKLEIKGSIGSSTPTLHHETFKRGGEDEFWKFKVPDAPKPKLEPIHRTEHWAESIEKLLGDSSGMKVFTEFLEHEFSAENIHFYTACLRFKESYPDLTPSQKISMASTIFQRHLQNGALDPINVDHQARNHVEKALSQPKLDMYDLPLAQVFNLLKFDCYPRFLKSDMYRDYVTDTLSVGQSLVEPTDSDGDSVKSQPKLQSDGRRRSLLPWNIKNRSKNKNRNKNEFGLNSDMSFIQKTAQNQNSDGLDQTEERRQSYKVCRVLLPDNSTTVLPCKPGESLSIVVQRLLEKREFNYSAFEVVSVSTGKPIDLNVEVSEITAREIKVEPRAFVGIELPFGWKVGIRANPTRKMAEVLKPVLSQHALKLDDIVVHDLDTGELVDLKCPVGRIDGHNINVQTKDFDEVTNHVDGFHPPQSQFFDDDQLSAKTSSSSHASSVFRGFLRRSPKKYKREKDKPKTASQILTPVVTSKNVNSKIISEATNKKSGEAVQELPPKSSAKLNDGNTSAIPKSLVSQGRQLLPGSGIPNPITNENSPLSLMQSELNLVKNSRNRNPIYMNQPTEPRKV